MLHAIREWWDGRQRAFPADEAGVAAIEFAFILPVLFAFLLGVICYGAYFWMAHDVQQLANESARSAIAGLDVDERRHLARQTLARNVERLSGLDADKASLTIDETGGGFTVTVSYDATGSAFWVVMDLFATPPQLISRSSTVALGGY